VSDGPSLVDYFWGGVNETISGLQSLWSNARYGTLSEAQRTTIREQTAAAISQAAGNNTALAEYQNDLAQGVLTEQFAQGDATAESREETYKRYLIYGVVAGALLLLLYGINTFAKVKQAVG
jgi:hypothetical protein